MKNLWRFIVLLLPVALMGCSYLSSQTILQNRNREYLHAASVPPLRIPPGVASSQLHSSYTVSNVQYSEAAKDVSLVPPGL